MLTSDAKQHLSTTSSSSLQFFATAKNKTSAQLKTLGIKDIGDLATRIGYLIVGAYGIAMVVNLTNLYA